MAILHFKNGVFISMLIEFLYFLKSNLLHILNLAKGTLLISGDLEVPLIMKLWPPYIKKVWGSGWGPSPLFRGYFVIESPIKSKQK